MKPTMHIAIWSLLACAMTVNLAYAAPKEGKGPDDKDKEPPGQARGQEGTPPGQQADRTPPGQERAAEAAANRAERAEAKTEQRADRADVRGTQGNGADRSHAAEAKVERQHPHQDRRAQAAADRGDNANKQIRLASAHGRGGDHGLRGRDAAKAHVDTLLKSLNKLEHARWDYNPHDTRGQGNMGKVDMRSPYGFDKDSGREGAERGRAIHLEEEPVILNLAEIVMVAWQVDDWYIEWLKYLLNYYRSLASVYSSTTWYSWYISWLESRVTNYYTAVTYDSIRINMDDTINYTLSFNNLPEGAEGSTLLVTTSLISINDYTNYVWTYNSTTRRWEWGPIHYDAGQVVVSQTQEVTLTETGTSTYSYDPPGDLTGYTGNYFELAVTVTEPVSGASYTLTYDRDLYLYRCPYGIVYDKTTGKPVVGAVVTVHNADGSIAVLDKGANPNVSNPQTTDATGRYNAKLMVGKKYYLSVKASGYADYRSGLFSERGPIVREDVGLTPVSQQPAASVDTPLPVPLGSLGSAELGASGLSPTALPAK